jgi:hypothetical protein
LRDWFDNRDIDSEPKVRESIIDAAKQIMSNMIMKLFYKALELILYSERVENEKELRKIQIEIDYFKESKDSVVQVFRDFLPAPIMIRLYYGYMEKNRELEKMKQKFASNTPQEVMLSAIQEVNLESPDKMACLGDALPYLYSDLTNFNGIWNNYLRDVFNRINEMIARNKGLAYKELLALRIGRGARNG